MVRCFCLCGGVCVVVFALFVLLLIVLLLLFVVVGQDCCIETAKVPPKHKKTTVDVVGLACLSLFFLCMCCFLGFGYFLGVCVLGLVSLLLGCCVVRCSLCCFVSIVVFGLFAWLLFVWWLLVVVGMDSCIETTKAPHNKCCCCLCDLFASCYLCVCFCCSWVCAWGCVLCCWGVVGLFVVLFVLCWLRCGARFDCVVVVSTVVVGCGWSGSLCRSNKNTTNKLLFVVCCVIGVCVWGCFLSCRGVVSFVVFFLCCWFMLWCLF